MKTRLLASIIAGLIITCSASAQPAAFEEKPLRDFQLSIIPAIGTDGVDAPNYRYRTSLNIFAGITGGIDGIELGGFLNITNGAVSGVQLSGFGNIVRDNQQGLQGAGFANIVGGNSLGLLGSGFANVTGGSSQGFFGAGFANITGGNFLGFAASGFGNITGGSSEGFQAAGFANITGGSHEGFSAAGFANITGGNSQGFQAAGFANLTKGDVKGPQFAGFLNAAKNVQGLQASGFLNVAKELKGLQIGFINVADTVASGVPIGFLSFVKKGGLRQIELAASDVLHLNASFRIGIPAFYNIFSYGIRPFETNAVGGFGYGIGSGFAVSQSAFMQLEAHTTQLHSNFKWSNDHLDLLNELRIIFGVNMTPRLGVFLSGVLYNQVYHDCPTCNYSSVDIAPKNTFHERSWNNYHAMWWAGIRGGLRFNL